MMHYLLTMTVIAVAFATYFLTPWQTHALVMLWIGISGLTIIFILWENPVATKLNDQVFSPLKGISAAHPWQQVHQWLCNALGAEPDRLVLTDPVQQLQVTIDVRPLMRILGGEWEQALNRAEQIKAQNSGGASKRGIATEGEEGAFLGASAKEMAARMEAAKKAKERETAIIPGPSHTLMPQHGGDAPPPPAGDGI